MPTNELERFSEQIIGNRITGIRVKQGDGCFLIERLFLSNGLTIRFLGDYDEPGMCKIGPTEEIRYANP